MKKKLERKYQDLSNRVAKMLSQNPTEDEALANLRALPRKDRRLAQRFAKKQEKVQDEKGPSEN
jgi:hypothetical protein